MEYISKKDYLEKNKKNTIVGYALFVRDNIKKDDYAKLNTGNIVKVLGIKENNCDKKAIYYGPCYYEDKWFDCSAVENFSKNIIDLIEEDDIVILEYYVQKYRQRITRKFEVGIVYGKIYFDNRHCSFWYDLENKKWGNGKGFNPKIKSILTKELFNQNSYKIGE